MTNPAPLTSEDRTRIIEQILIERQKQNPTAGSGYFAMARKGLDMDSDDSLINRAKRMNITVNTTQTSPRPLKVKTSKHTVGDTCTFEDGRTGTVTDITDHHTLFKMDDGYHLAQPH
jgi:hypothetical protein